MNRSIAKYLVAAVAVAAAAQASPTAADFAACNLEAEVAAAVRPMATANDRPGALAPSPDRLLEGMGADGLTDEAYREAYRTCMRGRGF